MAPSQLVWQSDNGKCSTLPWSAAGTGGLLLHRSQPFLGAWLRELWPGEEPRDVVEVSFYSQGFCLVVAFFPGGKPHSHFLRKGANSVRLRWEKGGDRGSCGRRWLERGWCCR
ncbi:unnamed protein product [Effrenium voratum]|nr:unnamed protein product [Effrenium voratum]